MCWFGTAHCDMSSILLTIVVILVALVGFFFLFLRVRAMVSAFLTHYFENPRERFVHITDHFVASAIIALAALGLTIVAIPPLGVLLTGNPKPIEVSPPPKPPEQTPGAAPKKTGVKEPVCAEARVPASSASLSDEQQLCALIACAGGEDKAAGRSLVEWFRILARKTGACDGADREALTNSVTLGQLYEARKALQPVVTRPAEVAVCNQVVREVIDGLERERRKVKERTYGVCNDAAGNAVSREVEEYLRNLTLR